MHTFNVPRVVFGRGTLKQLPAEAALLGGKAPFLVSTAQQTAQLEEVRQVFAAAGVTTAGAFSEAAMHTPAEVTERAEAALRAGAADIVVSIGGGSTIGLGKALSVRSGLPHLCVPTSYAGSEMTPILGETAGGRKTTRSDPRILPRTVVYDADLTASLPRVMRATSGVNALAHAVEALYARDGSPVVAAMAVAAVRLLADALPRLGAADVDAAAPATLQAQEDALYGAWLCGMCLGNVSMSIHHKLCHALGGSFGLPHGETHTAVLPHSLAYVAPRIGPALAQIAHALPDADADADTADAAIAGLNALLARLPVNLALRDYGFREDDIDKAADVALSQPYWSPRPLERDAIREVIRRVWAGEPARADL